jgi:radical SAM superfamily enzyme YgiQ (UPF0313 family)
VLRIKYDFMKIKFDLVLINPPTLRSRSQFYKDYVTFLHELNQVKAMNIGIMSISSYLSAKDFKIKIIDLLEFETVDSAEAYLKSNLAGIETKFFGISCNSGYSYLETLGIARIVKKSYSNSIILTGGQHIGPLKDIPLKECPELDINVLYEGERIIELLLNDKDISEFEGLAYRHGENIIVKDGYPPIVHLDDISPLNFSLYPNYHNFSPYIEESRGCYAKCHFCISTFMNKGRIRCKNFEVFEKELDNLFEYFPKIDLLEVLASTFGVNIKNAIGIINALKKRKIKWTTEFRADSLWDKNELLKKMVDSGLTILNIGVESLSPEILIKMNKTKEPEKYIKRVIKLIQECRKYPQLSLKFNMMMYYGETPQTISETLKILFENKDHISEVRFSPLFAFPGTISTINLNDESLYKNSFSNMRHMYPVNLSKYYDAHSALILCWELERIFSDVEFTTDN